MPLEVRQDAPAVTDLDVLQFALTVSKRFCAFNFQAFGLTIISSWSTWKTYSIRALSLAFPKTIFCRQASIRHFLINLRSLLEMKNSTSYFCSNQFLPLAVPQSLHANITSPIPISKDSPPLHLFWKVWVSLLIWVAPQLFLLRIFLPQLVRFLSPRDCTSLSFATLYSWWHPRRLSARLPAQTLSLQSRQRLLHLAPVKIRRCPSRRSLPFPLSQAPHILPMM